MGSTDARYKLVIRVFNLEKDYVIIQKWWIAHGSFPPKPEHLSSTGIVIEADNQPVCAGWLYKTDSKICVFEFVVSDPNACKEKRDAALMLLIETIKKLASKNGYSLIYTSVSSQKYINRLSESGFIEADKGQTHMFYEVG